MKCKRMRGSIHEYLDQELPPGQWPGLNEHLDRCAACRNYLARMRETRDFIRRFPPVSPPAELGVMVRGRLGLGQALAESPWFAGLQFRMLDLSAPELLRSAFLATPIALVFFVAIAFLVYAPGGIQNIELLLSPAPATYVQQNLVERQYLENMYDFSPEQVSAGHVYQPRISTVSVKIFAENDFQSLRLDHLGVLARVRRDGSTQVESVTSGDRAVIERVENMLESSIMFPAIANGKIIDSTVWLTFEKVEVKG